MKVILYRDSSFIVLQLRDNLTNAIVSGLLYWPPKENVIYFLSNLLPGAVPLHDDWKRLGYIHSYMLRSVGVAENSCTFDPMNYLPNNFSFYNYDKAIDASRTEEAALKTDLNSLKKVDTAHQQMIIAKSIVGENVGARVEALTPNKKEISGVLVKQRGRYYILHGNPNAAGFEPEDKMFCLHDDVNIAYSWLLQHDVIGSSDILPHTFKLLHSIPIRMITASPISKLVASPSYDPTTFEKKESKTEEAWHPLSDATVTIKKEEPELILFKKSTAKVTRCDIQPMQSPQIITKNKK